MIYLRAFSLPDDEAEADFFLSSPKAKRNGRDSTYPFLLFRGRQMPVFRFSDITVICGNNGSGKSTLLNVIAGTLGLRRTSDFNRSEFFEDYTAMCHAEVTGRIPRQSAVITSDDVFERLLDIRRLNAGIDDRRAALVDDWVEERGRSAGGEANLLGGLEDFERWQDASRKRRHSQSSYLRSRLVRNVTERSNGESALSYFVDAIADGGLYLLDEPENSLSPENQLALRYFLEDAVAEHGCQFLLSTHSPFLLALRHARIYDIDATPPAVTPWTDLPCVRVYKNFFEENADAFR